MNFDQFSSEATQILNSMSKCYNPNSPQPMNSFKMSGPKVELVDVHLIEKLELLISEFKKAQDLKRNN